MRGKDMGKADYKKMSAMDDKSKLPIGKKNRCYKIKREVSKKRRRLDKKEVLFLIEEI